MTFVQNLDELLILVFGGLQPDLNPFDYLVSNLEEWTFYSLFWDSY